MGSLVLLDGASMWFRSFFGVPSSITAPDGRPVNAVRGFLDSIATLITRERPGRLVVCLDLDWRPQFRVDLIPSYKAHRVAEEIYDGEPDLEEVPDELTPQVDMIMELLDAFGIATAGAAGYEADDIIGALSRRAAERGDEVLIVSGDRDEVQLVRPGVELLAPIKGMTQTKTYDEAAVHEEYGVSPAQIIDLKGLAGDSSDNIPGVPGVGEKTAVSLLQQYPTLEEIYAHIDELKGAVRTRLENGRELAFLSRDLATIRTDVGISLDLEKARANDLNLPAVEAIFRELEFRTLIARLPKLAPGYQPPQSAAPGGQLSLFGEPITQISQSETFDNHYTVVNTPEALRDLQQILSKAECLAVIPRPPASIRCAPSWWAYPSRSPKARATISRSGTAPVNRNCRWRRCVPPCSRLSPIRACQNTVTMPNTTCWRCARPALI